ncbi:RimJ/RimL family protein N-acetyltransferase [Sinorhizobium fredii]|jgi:RimJ/RimL family protein N-acetyltransferase|uniref:Acetyltransferase, GNAT family n=1 Tax=Sinorhizobium fredii (strain USDA 257) TaxID=1185652 RepID=I3X8R5_SINF2|nr:GNAT family protein [Sinorhizobium fredii]AFL52271.1 acetyltransferase, GNAT family [Sinorhizobium fredii USDA 257]
MKSNLPQLQGARLTLRRPTREDVDVRLALRRHKEIIEAYGGTFDPDAPFTREHAEAAIRYIEEQEYAWVIDAGRFIGHVRFHSIDRQDRRAALAIGIDDPAYLGRGYGTEAIRLALTHAFSTGLHRISLRVLASNSRAMACYRKCGFVEEGREREAAFVNGGWEDDIIMGVLDREFCPS